MPTSVGAVLFDLDGVIRFWNRERQRAAYLRLGTDIAGVAQVVRRGRDGHQEWLWPLASTGRIDGETYRAELRRRLDQAYGRDIGGSIERIRGAARIDRDLLAYVDRLRLLVPVALVSNSTTRLYDDLARLDVTKHFDLVLPSAVTGARKPEPGVYRAAAERLGVPARSCVFVDDKPSNVRGAEAVGMIGIHYTGLADLITTLRGLGLDPDAGLR